MNFIGWDKYLSEFFQALKVLSFRTDLNLEELDVKFGAEVANPKKKIMSILGGDSR